MEEEVGEKSALGRSSSSFKGREEGKEEFYVSWNRRNKVVGMSGMRGKGASDEHML